LRERGGVMGALVEFLLEDGSTIFFEAADGTSGGSSGGLVQEHGGVSSAGFGGRLQEQMERVAAAAQEVAATLRKKLTPDEIEVELGVTVSGTAGVFMFASSRAESAITVRLKWQSSRAEPGEESRVGTKS
jgi:hypothetical protein